ncbi:MAG TPA: shikimate dehydrogenase [Jiangellaceae bacterium]|nr:shikimate dehydrogenase [Jiangellaceae bacterium]
MPGEHLLMTRRRCGVLGSPISHSRSPELHRAAYRHLALDWTYTAHEVEVTGLAPFVAALDPSWRGLSLTMPLKRAALDLADRSSPVAREVGAANTLLIEPDGTLVADNTDVPGLVAAVRAAAPGLATTTACVWGGGATAASAVAALRVMDIVAVHLHARDVGRAAGTVAVGAALGLPIPVRTWRVGDECGAAGLTVSTAPAGAADGIADDLAESAGPGRLLFDVVYDPWPTPLAAAWEKRGGAVASGLDLLVHQAVGQVRLMTGRDVPAGVLYAAVS